jgi:chorismate dehydratase
MLLSNCPFDDITDIYLDYRSRSSVNLTKILAKNSWKRDFRWINTSKEFDFRNIGLNEGVVLIGDQCFEFENSFRYKTDLATEWNKFSGLPFVFACWTANITLEDEFITDFNNALKLGVDNIDDVVEKLGKTGTITGDTLRTYLTENIDYNFNEEKKAGLKLFLELLGEI